MSGACWPGPTVLVGSKEAGPLTRLMRRHWPRQSGYLESSSACAPRVLARIAATATNDPIEARRGMTVPIIEVNRRRQSSHISPQAAIDESRCADRAGDRSSCRGPRASRGRCAFFGDAPARHHVSARIVEGVDGDQLSATAIFHGKSRRGAVADNFGVVVAVGEARHLQLDLVLVRPEPGHRIIRLRCPQDAGGGGLSLIDGVLHALQAQLPPEAPARETGAVPDRVDVWRRGACERVDQNADAAGEPGAAGKVVI